MGGPSPDRDWRDAHGYRRLLDVDRAGIMWEWLRRDPHYVAWHARVHAGPEGEAAPREDLTQWGLHFRRTSGGRGTGRAVDLARRP